jgi:hypothetical protein
MQDALCREYHLAPVIHDDEVMVGRTLTVFDDVVVA